MAWSAAAFRDHCFTDTHVRPVVLLQIEIRSIGRKASSFKKKRLEQQRTAAAL
jgi:hypothetical protein